MAGISGRKVLAISGAARNIGKAIAAHFLSHGWDVAVIDVDGRAVEVLDLPEDRALKYTGDVTNEYDVAEFYVKIREKFGRLDVIVNNAAVGGFKNFLDLTVDEWRKVIEVNLTGYFLMVRFGIPLMLESSGKGSVVNISSTRALMSEPGNEAYSASKAGVLGLTHALANSLGPNVRVNAVCPGWILHDDERITEAQHRQHPVGRAGNVEDVARLVYFLADDEQSGFITGQAFIVDGGMTKKMIYV